MEGCPVGARPHGEGGGLAMARSRAGGPGHEQHAVGQRQPGNGGAGSRIGEAREEREGRERGSWSVGQPVEWGPAAERRGGLSHCGWTGLEGRAQLAGKER
jgi:hypothetical protein